MAGLSLLAVAVMPAEARAHQVCVDIPLDGLEDASPDTDFTPADIGEDHGRSDAYGGDRPFRAQHWLARVIVESAPNNPDLVGQILWGYEPLDVNGCTGEFDVPGPVTEFRVVHRPWAYWSSTDNSVVALDCDNMPECHFPSSDPGTVVSVSGGSETELTLIDPDLQNPKRLYEYVLWGTSFAENHRSFFDDTTVYVSHDENGDLQDGTSASWRVGNQPTAIFKGAAWQWKFIHGHEFGHLVTTFAAMTPPFMPTDPNCGYNGSSHSFSNPEWQTCAALEGMAHFFSLSVWYDIPATGNLNYPIPGSTIQQIGGAAFCDAMTCTAGLAIERDWASALLDFHQVYVGGGDGATLEEILHAPTSPHGMLDAAHPWTSQTGTSDWWDDFDVEMNNYFSTNQYNEWSTIAATKELDQ